MIQMNINVAINTSQLLRHFTRVRVSWCSQPRLCIKPLSWKWANFEAVLGHAWLH